MFEYRLPMLEEDTGSGGGEPQTIKIGDKEFNIDDLQTKLTGYEKLEKQFTKVSQENSELKKTAEKAKQWIDFDQYVGQFPPDVQQKFVESVNSFFAAAQSGNVTQQDITGINKAIKTAEKAGDDKTADSLKDARDEALQNLQLSEMYEELEERAEEDGIDFKKRDFKRFLEKWTEEEGYEEDDVLTKRDINRAYKDYRAMKKEKADADEQKRNLPNVGTGGTGIGVGNTKPNNAPKNLKEAAKMALQRLGG